jgi:hypothetical protein
MTYFKAQVMPCVFMEAKSSNYSNQNNDKLLNPLKIGSEVAQIQIN